MHQNSWQQRAVLITGGCGGVGKATAGRFLSDENYYRPFIRGRFFGQTQ